MENQTKLLILDKDGTLVRPASGSRFPQGPEDQVLLPGVARTLDRYVRAGWWPVMASNQGGCESINPEKQAPYKSIEDAIREMNYCMALLPEIRHALFCPHIQFGETCIQVGRDGTVKTWREEALIHKANHGACSGPTPRQAGCRKPNPGMILVAQTIFGSLENTLFVGDRPEDQGAALIAGIQFAWAKDWVGNNTNP